MISIIIPTYNSATFIRKCLQSVINQTYRDWELLLMDGASKDDTAQIAKSFKDERIHIYSEPDKGVYDAMNKGIDLAQGDWLYFLGSDDWLYEPKALEKMVAYLDPAYDVVYGEVDSDLPEWHKGEWTLDKIKANRCHQCIFYNKRFFANGLRYNLRYRILADYDLNLRWLLSDKYLTKHVPVLVAHYSMEGLSSTHNDKVFYNDWGLLLRKYNHRRLSPRYKKIAAKTYLELNQLSLVEKIIWKTYYVFFYIVQHIEQMMGVDQNNLRNP